MENTINEQSDKYNINSPVHFILDNKRIGYGSYGNVLLCHNKNGQSMAVKCIKTDNYGINNLFELAIMRTIIHPNINTALGINVKEIMKSNTVYIIQDVAVSDLQDFIETQQYDINTVLSWCNMIYNGVLELHKNKIIHGDIKTSNILIYKNKTLKLTDYSLSTTEDMKNNYCAYTSSHRPIECFIENRLESKSDIWALGCTIFQIYTKKQLFPSQDKSQSINAIMDFSINGPNSHLENINIDHNNTYHHLSFNRQINDLKVDKLFDMLRIYPKDRISIFEILDEHHTIENITKISEKNNTNKKIVNSITAYLKNKKTIEMASKLYGSLKNLKKLSEHIKIQACCWLTSKLFYNRPPDICIYPSSLNKIIKAEKIILDFIDYKILDFI